MAGTHALLETFTCFLCVLQLDLQGPSFEWRLGHSLKGFMRENGVLAGYTLWHPARRYGFLLVSYFILRKYFSETFLRKIFLRNKECECWFVKHILKNMYLWCVQLCISFPFLGFFCCCCPQRIIDYQKLRNQKWRFNFHTVKKVKSVSSPLVLCWPWYQKAVGQWEAPLPAARPILGEPGWTRITADLWDASHPPANTPAAAASGA